MPEICLPSGADSVETVVLETPFDGATARAGQPLVRRALAAAHVVADPFADIDPCREAAIDMDATLAFRRHLWSLGLGVAEAMDTAQRGMGLTWPAAREVIAETAAAARHTEDAEVYSGVGTDQLDTKTNSLDDIARAYLEQLAFVQKTGSRVVVMASRALARVASAPSDYARVYARIFDDLDQPAILHWLGAMFDPALACYWGVSDIGDAMDACLDIIHANAAKVQGIKISLLDADLEVAMRRRLPDGVRMYTGDDFNYPDLIAGDGEHDSDALLGVFDPIAPLASAALAALSEGDGAAFSALLRPTVPLAHELFAAPTRYYKTGVVFLAYLNGHQTHFAMVGGQQSARSLPHLVRLFRLANRARLLRDPDLAARRMRNVLATYGFEA